MEILRFAREGISPSEYKQLSLNERQLLRGYFSGEAAAQKVKRGL